MFTIRYGHNLASEFLFDARDFGGALDFYADLCVHGVESRVRGGDDDDPVSDGLSEREREAVEVVEQWAAAKRLKAAVTEGAR